MVFSGTSTEMRENRVQVVLRRELFDTTFTSAYLRFGKREYEIVWTRPIKRNDVEFHVARGLGVSKD